MQWSCFVFFQKRFISSFFFLAVLFTVHAQQDLTTNGPASIPNTTPILSPAPAISPKPLSKTHFLRVAAINFLKVIPSPPKPHSVREERDREMLHDVIATRTQEQMKIAKTAIEDNVFDYAAALGPNFNPATYPHLSKLFGKIKQDTNVAIRSAKNTFHRSRPDTWEPMNEESENKRQEGFAYPSGHSTRAFVWAALLAHLFPEKSKEINAQARQKAWNRVILGRHYPNDVYAGEVYGKFLAEEFLKDPEFEHEWEAIQKEVAAATASNNVLPAGVTNNSTNNKSGLVNDNSSPK